MNKFETKLPSKYIVEMKKMLVSDYEKYAKALDSEPVRGLRVNTKRISVDEFLKSVNYEIEKLPFVSDGLLLKTEEKLGNSYEHLSGQFYLQEPSSMIPVIASNIENDKRSLKVLDLCASPGGKTSQIASRISEDSILFSNEIIKSRSQVLYSNVERQGFKNVIILNEIPENLKNFQGYFDYVFVDAPCSGEGMFRKNPDTILEWSEENVKMCSQRQKEILSIAQSLVKTGGKLIYSTCTFSLEEDEQIVEWFVNCCKFNLVKTNDEIEKITRLSKANVKNGDYARKFLPYISKGEGQFVAVFEKYGEEQEHFVKPKKHFSSINILGNSKRKLVDEFLKNNFTSIPDGKFYEVGDSIYFAPKILSDKEQSILDDLKFLLIGVKFGQIIKDRFEPNHFCFMALDDFFKQKITLSNEEIKKYLHGEEIIASLSASGYGVVLYGNSPLGGVKIVGNKLKNLYPKGLRI